MIFLVEFPGTDIKPVAFTRITLAKDSLDLSFHKVGGCQFHETSKGVDVHNRGSLVATITAIFLMNAVDHL